MTSLMFPLLLIQTCYQYISTYIFEGCVLCKSAKPGFKFSSLQPSDGGCLFSARVSLAAFESLPEEQIQNSHWATCSVVFGLRSFFHFINPDNSAVWVSSVLLCMWGWWRVAGHRIRWGYNLKIWKKKLVRGILKTEKAL